jgi:hypothetical protein
LPTKVYERFDLKGFFDCLTGLVFAQSRSFGRNEKPYEHKSYFYLLQNSDRRKLVLWHSKKAFMEYACNGKLDWLQKKTTDFEVGGFGK